MLKHIVFMKFKPDLPDTEAVRLEQELRALPGIIPEILSYEMGKDIVHSERSFDFALIGTFRDLSSLKKYISHPEHQEILKHINEICDTIKSVDFEISSGK